MRACKQPGCAKRPYEEGYCTRHYRMWLDDQLQPAAKTVKPVARTVKPVAAEPRQIPHGTPNGYGNYGCRCDSCKRAHSEYMAAAHSVPCVECGEMHFGRYRPGSRCAKCYGRKRTADRLKRTNVHGTWSAYQSGCRCERCREHSRLARYSYRDRHPEENVWDNMKVRVKRWAEMTPQQRLSSTVPANIAQKKGISEQEARALLDEMEVAFRSKKSRREIYAIYERA